MSRYPHLEKDKNLFTSLQIQFFLTKIKIIKIISKISYKTYSTIKSFEKY